MQMHQAWVRSAPVVAALLITGSATGCAAEIPVFDDDPRPELCGGAVCFAPDHVAVRHWGDGEVTVAAWRGGSGAVTSGSGCELPRSGEEPIPGQAIVLELKNARPGDRVPIVAHEHAYELDVPHAVVRALRVDPETGRALADEEGVSGEATILDLDAREGRLRVRIRARWSSGVSGELLLDLDGWQGC